LGKKLKAYYVSTKERKAPEKREPTKGKGKQRESAENNRLMARKCTIYDGLTKTDDRKDHQAVQEACIASRREQDQRRI
jgi:hypothetical protein